MRRSEHDEERLAQRRAQYEREDINGRLVFSLLDINHTMRGLYEGRGSQKRVLMVLNETGPITQRRLTERLGIQPGSASEVIAKLENAGLLVRTPSADDRRTADISLTEKGREQAAEAKNQRAERHVEMFSVLDGEEKAQLLALLEKVNAGWEERYGQRLRQKEHHGCCHGGEGRRHGRHSCSEGKGRLEQDG